MLNKLNKLNNAYGGFMYCGARSLSVFILFCLVSVTAFANEPESGNSQVDEQKSQIEALENELSNARDKVSELESELQKARARIAEMENATGPALVADDSISDPTDPKESTVRGEPLYDVYNPKKAITTKTVLTEKYPQETQSQPVAMTRLLQDDLVRSRIRHIDRISDQVPNMQYGQTGNEARISIRGARTNRTGAEAEQVVAIFEDGVSVPTTTQALGPYVDINRIEVLRGPQGVMYGRNAIGGVINIISNEPDPSGWDAAFEGDFGYADGTRFDAMINIPVADTLTTRIAARYDMHSGYINNFVLEGDADDLRDRKQQFVRWMTTWQPTEKFSVAVNLASLDQNQTGSGIWGYHQAGAYIDGEYVAGHQFRPANSNAADRNGWNVARDFASLEDQENLSGTLKINWDIEFATLQWFINKSKFENQQVFDPDYSDGGDRFNSSFNGWDSFRDTISSELKLVSNRAGRFDWLAGLYWLDMESNWGWLETVHGEFQQPAWDSTGRYKTDSKSAFATLGYQFTDSLRLSGGLRYYDDGKTLRTGESNSWDGVLWNAALEYAVNENINTWFSVSTGYRPGGINETPGTPGSWDSETVSAYEIGMKSVLLDDTLALNLSAFYNDYKDVQAQSFTILPLPGNAGLMDYITTGGGMESKGVEAEIQWMPGDRWNISANIAWLDAKFKNYTVPALAGLGVIDGHSQGDMIALDGWRPALSPEWSMGFQASYVFSLGRSGTFTPMIQTTFVGDQYASDFNLPGTLQKSYTKTDLRLNWDLPGNKINLQFYLENIEEEMNMNNAMIYNPVERPEIATILTSWGDPMTYGISMSYKW